MPNRFQAIIDDPSLNAPLQASTTQTSTMQAEQEKQKGKSLFRKAGEFIGEPVIKLGEDVGNIIGSRKLSESSAQADTNLLNQLPELKQKFAKGELSLEQYNQRLRQIKDQPSFDPGVDLPSTERVIGDVVGSVLTFTPAWEIKALKSAPVLEKLVRGGIIGAGYGSAAAMSENAKLQEVLKAGLVGGLIGAPLELAAGYFAKKVPAVVGGGTRKAVEAADEITAGKASEVVSKIRQGARKVFQTPVGNLARSVYTRLEQDYGADGMKIAQLYRKANTQAKIEMGQMFDGFVKSGLFEADDDMLWRSSGSLLDQLEGRVTGSTDNPMFDAADRLRKDIAFRAVDKVPNWQGIDKYYPHNVPNIEILKPAKLGTNKVRQDILENMVLRENFASLEDAAKVLDSYVELVESGGKIGKGKDVIKYLLETGQAQSEEEAIGKLMREARPITDTKNPISGFLERPRELNVPFYDPNPARSLLLYASDAYHRINTIEAFGQKDEILNELIGKITKEQGYDAGKGINDIVKIIAGEVEFGSQEQKLVKNLKALNTMKLTFAALPNISQTLNEMLISDLGPWARGIKLAFDDVGISNAMKTGATIEQFMRQKLLEQGYGTNFADTWLKRTGFSYTERLNRTIAGNIGMLEAENLARKLGLEVDEQTMKNVSGMLAQKEAEQRFMGETVLKKRTELMDQFNKDFPLPFADEKFKLKTVEGAVGRLQRLEGVAAKKTERLQKLLSKLDNQVIKQGKRVGTIEEATKELTDTIESLRKEISGFSQEDLSSVQVQGFETSADEVNTAIERVTQLSKKELQDTVSALEEKLAGLQDEYLQQIDAEGSVAKTMDGVSKTVAGKPKNAEEKLVQLVRTRDKIQSALVALQNEVADKQRILEGIIDPRPLAEVELKKQFPNAGAYEKYLASKEKAGVGKLNPFLENRLKDLIGEDRVKEAKLRGFLTEEDMLFAGQRMSEMTQFGIETGNVPSWAANSSLGKLMWQFKNFAVSQARFVKNNLADSAERGDWKRFWRNVGILAVVFPLTSEVVYDLRSLITGEKRPTKLLDRYIQDVTNMSGMGVVNDFMQSAKRGQALAWIAGPTFTSLENYGESLFSGNLKELFMDVVKDTGIGRPVINYFQRQKRTPGRENIYKTIQDLFSQGPLTPKTALAAGGNAGSEAVLTQQGVIDENGKNLSTSNSVSSLYQGVGIHPEKPNIISDIDLTRYAADPKHESNVTRIYKGLPEFVRPEDVDNYIRSKFKKSPLTGQMVISAANEFGIDPKLLVAIMQQDSGMGTAGKGAKNRNPGNVATYGKKEFVYPSWLDGVRGAARALARFRVENDTQLTMQK